MLPHTAHRIRSSAAARRLTLRLSLCWVAGELCSLLLMAVLIATSDWQGLADEAVQYANLTVDG